MATKKLQKPYSVSNAEDFKTALEELHDSLSNIELNASYLDFYNIQRAVDAEEDLPSAINQLTPGTALVINTLHKFTLNEVEYSTGDIVLKLMNEEVIHISAQLGGVYYPKSLVTRDEGYTLSYGYYPASPESGVSKIETVGNAQNVLDVKQDIIFEIKDSNADANIYGMTLLISNDPISFSFPIKVLNGVQIKPFLKFYFGSGTGSEITLNEEIYIEYTLIANNGVWNVLIDETLSSTNKIYAVVK